MATYNPSVYDKYIADSDFLGLADYIEQFIPDMDDENQQIQLRQNVANLRRFGGIANKILQSEIPENDRELFKFHAQKQYGAIDSNNTYYKKYNDYKNKIGTNNHWFKADDIATSIAYEFDNDDIYNDFIDKTGIVVENTAGMYKSNANGKPTLIVGKTAFQDDDLFDRITKGLTLIPEGFDFNPSYSFGTPGPIYGFNTLGFNEKGEKISEVNGFDSNQEKALRLLRDSDDVFDKYYTKQYQRIVPANLVSMGYMCGAQRDLTNRLFNQQIGESTYNAYNKAIIDYYDRQLATLSLTGYDEVYMTEPGNASQTLSLISNEDKGAWTEYLRNAVKEGRATYTAGYAGDRVGTIITLSPKPLSGELNKEEYAKGVQIFVPGLFDEDARNMINEDDNAKVMVEVAEHQVFGHNYNLIEGGRLKDFDGNGGAIYEDDNTTYYLDSNQVKDLMKRNILIEGGIQAAKTKLKKDDNGNILNNQTDLVSLVDAYSKNVYADLYNINTQEEFEKILEDDGVLKQIDNIFITILNKLGLDRLGNRIR